MSHANELVYIVDDDASVRLALTRVFHSAGYKTLTFKSAYEFLDRQPTDAKSCLVLDIRMPGMSGLELVDRLRQSEIKLPVILITGHEYQERKPELPVLACFHKPLNSDQVLDTIENAFASQAAAE